MTESGTNAQGQNLAALKIPELRKIAAEKGIKGLSGLRKGELIEAINTGVAPRRGAATPTGRTSSHEAAADPATSTGESGRQAEAPAGEQPRRRATRRRGAPAADYAPAAHARDEANRGDNADNADNGTPAGKADNVEHSGVEDQQRYESRSAARRARRNRARQNHDDNDQRDNDQRDNDQRDNDQRDNKDNPEDTGGFDKDAHRSNRSQRDNREDRDNRGGKGGRNNRDELDGGGRRGRRGRRNRNRNRGDNSTSTGTDNGGNAGNNQDFDPSELQEVAGIIDVVDNNSAFIRTTGYRQNQADVFVNNKLVRHNGLRSGDAVIGQVRANGQGHSHGNGRNRQRYNQLVRVDTVNGMSPEEAKQRKEFHKLTPLYPNKRLRLETEPNILTTRVIDLVMPIGKGQRALIVSPPKAGKTTILQNIANAIATNNPECYLMVVLVDERPEEVTDMQRSVKGEVIASTFDRPPSEHTAVAELAIERAKRLVEMGQDVVVLLDSITRLGRAYNNSSPASGRILSGGVDSNALYPPKRFLGAARNIEEGGSLTIIATAMVETGSAGDTVIFEEFKGTGNAELKLDRKIAERRVFPAVDVNPSGTRKDELLMSPEEARVMHKLRRILSALDPQQSIDMLIKQLKKTKSNGEFLMGVANSAPMAAAENEEEYS
ncbi:transcription termination factor Rho [Corynebacterium mayonis]|uniref:transcription termination factor Rho n=1 Tax=Corynebacterium mayonis TaxID=3062461 RepID=UPI0031401A72